MHHIISHNNNSVEFYLKSRMSHWCEFVQMTHLQTTETKNKTISPSSLGLKLLMHNFKGSWSVAQWLPLVFNSNTSLTCYTWSENYKFFLLIFLLFKPHDFYKRRFWVRSFKYIIEPVSRMWNSLIQQWITGTWLCEPDHSLEKSNKLFVNSTSHLNMPLRARLNQDFITQKSGSVCHKVIISF